MPLRTVVYDAASRPHKLALVHPGPPVPDGEGGYTEVWAPLEPPTVWGAISTLSAAEATTAGTIQTTATYLVRTEFHPGITTETRLTFGGRTFEVQSVQNVDERNICLDLLCAEVKYEQS